VKVRNRDLFSWSKEEKMVFPGEFENGKKNLIFCMGAPPIISLWTLPFEGFSEIMIITVDFSALEKVLDVP
jgi:hypothetical protein